MALKKLFIGWLLWCSCILVFSSQDLSPNIKNQSFIPPNYYVGDEVSVWIRCQGVERKDFQIPEELALDPWMEILKIDIRQIDKEWLELEISFRVFKPGELKLPALDFGDYFLPEINIETHSIFDIGEKSEFRPPRGQMFFPYTMIRLVLLTLVLFGTPVGLFFLGRFLYRYYIRWDRYRRLRLPRNKLLRGFRKLRRKLVSIDEREFCIIFIDLLKTFLSERYTDKILNMTSYEVHLFLEDKLPEKQVAGEIDGLLKLSDLVKFSGKTISKDEMEALIRQGEKISQYIEEEVIKNVNL